MLLVIDVGNTNTVLGLFDGKNLIHDWRIRTEIDHTIDEYGVLIYNLYQSSRKKKKPSKRFPPLLSHAWFLPCSIFWNRSVSSISMSSR